MGLQQSISYQLAYALFYIMGIFNNRFVSKHMRDKFLCSLLYPCCQPLTVAMLRYMVGMSVNQKLNVLETHNILSKTHDQHF